MKLKKKLYRSKRDRMIGGVLGGIAEYVDWDPTIVRLLYAIFTVLSMFIGILIYVLAWIIIPTKK